MEAQDEVAALMPRTMHGRRLSNASFDSESLKAYQAAMSKLRVSQAPLANVAEEAPARSGVALWRRRSGGTGRAGAAAKKPFVFKNWEAPAPAPALPARAEKTPAGAPADRPRRVSFLDMGDDAVAAENTPPVAPRAAAPVASRRASAAPPPLFEDASPASQAYLTAARARLQGLARADGSLARARGAGPAPSAAQAGRGFDLQLRGTLPTAPRASPQPLDSWLAHAAPSPRGAEAAAAAARRRGAAPAKPVLVAYTPPPPGADGTPAGGSGDAPRSRWLRDTPGRVGVAPAPLALTPPALNGSASPLSPTPTPGVSPLPPPPARAAAETQTSPLAEPAMQQQPEEFSFRLSELTPAAQRQRATGPAQPVPARADAGVGPSPPAGGLAESPAFFGGAGGDDLDAPPMPDFDDDAAGVGGDAGGWDDGADDGDAAAAAAAAARAKRATRPPGTPNKRLKAAMRARKSLAHAGLRTEEATGVRRSTRERLRPLEYWRNETKTYGRTHRSLPTVTAVTLRSPEPAWPAPDGWKPPRARAGRVPAAGAPRGQLAASDSDDASGDEAGGGSDSEPAPRRKAKPANKGSKRAKAAAKAPLLAGGSDVDDDGDNSA